MKQIYLAARSFGPYLAMALLVPGGSVIAPLLWLARHRRRVADVTGRLPHETHAIPADPKLTAL